MSTTPTEPVSPATINPDKSATPETTITPGDIPTPIKAEEEENENPAREEEDENESEEDVREGSEN